MASIANYVKFLRGTPTAYNNLAVKDADTLYFISEEDATTGKLYLGSVLIAGSLNESNVVGYLSKLQDVNTSGTVQNNVLGYDESEKKWVPMDVNSLVNISVMTGATINADGSSGLVPAPTKDDINKFLRGDGTWTLIEDKNIQVFEVELSVDETYDSAIVRVVNNAELHIGDLVIIKDDVEYITFVYTGSKWMQINGNQFKSVEELTTIVNGIIDSVDALNTLTEQLEQTIATKANASDVEELSRQLADKANAADVYTIEQADKAIADQVAAADHLKRKIVESKESIDIDADDATQYIYMAPSGLTNDSNRYYEYMVFVDNDNVRYVERVGQWEVDLTNYATLNDLNNKVDKTYYSVFVYDENGNPVYEDDGTTQKTERVEGTLLSPTDKEKLNALVIGDNGVEISGKVNAFNVEDLNVWIEQNRNNINGLLSIDTQAKVDNIIDPIIYSVNPNEFTLTEAKQLNLASISLNKVENLEDLLNAKDNAIETLDTKIINIEESLNNYVLKDSLDNQLAVINTDLSTLKQAMQWGSLIE